MIKKTSHRSWVCHVLSVCVGVCARVFCVLQAVPCSTAAGQWEGPPSPASSGLLPSAGPSHQDLLRRQEPPAARSGRRPGPPAGTQSSHRQRWLRTTKRYIHLTDIYFTHYYIYNNNVLFIILFYTKNVQVKYNTNQATVNEGDLYAWWSFFQNRNLKGRVRAEVRGKILFNKSRQLTIDIRVGSWHTALTDVSLE